MNISLSLFSAAAALKQISYFFLLFGSVGHCFFLVGVVTFQHLIKINRFDTFKRARVHRTLNTQCVCVCACKLEWNQFTTNCACEQHLPFQMFICHDSYRINYTAIREHPFLFAISFSHSHSHSFFASRSALDLISK